MKQLFFFLFVLTFCTAPCHAQFSTLGKILKVGKTIKDAKKAWTNKDRQIVEDLYNDVKVDTLNVENPKDNPVDANREDSKNEEYQIVYERSVKTSSIVNDPVYRKLIAEQRQATMEEATYLNDKYGTSIEYQGMEAFNDSIGAFAHLANGMQPMIITKFKISTDEKPIPDIEQDAMKQYIQDYLALLKKDPTDKIVVDSVPRYFTYSGSHANEQFQGSAYFTLYSNLEAGIQPGKEMDAVLRKLDDFKEPIDPNIIFVFKVHRGIGCRYMKYEYSMIKYRQSELVGYISSRLVKEKYVDKKINQKCSDKELFMAIDRMETEFKFEKLSPMWYNGLRYQYKDIILPAENVKIATCSRKIGHVNVLDVTIDAEPGEYAFIIRKPDGKRGLALNSFILGGGVFLFSIK